MQPSADDEPAPDQTLAVVAESLYLVNLLLLPGIAFVMLLVIYRQKIKQAAPLARCHLQQTVFASLWAGVLLIIANAVILLLGGYDAGSTWVIVVLYFTTVHTTLVILGTIGLARAMAGKMYRYPVIGRKCHGL